MTLTILSHSRTRHNTAAMLLLLLLFLVAITNSIRSGSTWPKIHSLSIINWPSFLIVSTQWWTIISIVLSLPTHPQFIPWRPSATHPFSIQSNIYLVSLYTPFVITQSPPNINIFKMWHGTVNLVTNNYSVLHLAHWITPLYMCHAFRGQDAWLLSWFVLQHLTQSIYTLPPIIYPIRKSPPHQPDMGLCNHTSYNHQIGVANNIVLYDSDCCGHPFKITSWHAVILSCSTQSFLTPCQCHHRILYKILRFSGSNSYEKKSSQIIDIELSFMIS